MTSEPLDSHKTLAAQVHERIRETIIHQKIKPGTRIDQNRLAEDLNVSIVPVREALKTLEGEGLVTIIPRRGAFVTEVSLEHLDDLYFARQIIEGAGIYYAIPNLQTDDFHQLDDLMQQMRVATESHNIQKFMDLNRDFHMLIYKRIGSDHFLQTIVNLWERSELYRYRYMFVLHNAENVHAEHQAILDACRNEQREEAKTLAMQHIYNTQQGLHLEIEAQLNQEAD